MSRLSRLDALAALLAGELPAGIDWMSVLALANQALVTPELYAAATRTGAVSAMPADVRGFLQEVWRRNRARNRRLAAQLRDALAVLNAAGFEPTLLKGAALWALDGFPAEYDRMLTDLDLMVGGAGAERAVRALEEAGFAARVRYPGPRFHVAAELARPRDVGCVDLHRRPPGPAGFAEAAVAAEGQLHAIRWEGVRARAPSPAVQVYLLVLHDEFHEGGYWRGGFAPRHLLDIAALSRRPGGVDWDRLAALPQTSLIRNAIDVQLLAAARLMGAAAPARSHRRWARLQHARVRAQYVWPSVAVVLALLGVASELRNVTTHQRRVAADRLALFGTGASASWRVRCRDLIRRARAAAEPGRV